MVRPYDARSGRLRSRPRGGRPRALRVRAALSACVGLAGDLASRRRCGRRSTRRWRRGRWCGRCGAAAAGLVTYVGSVTGTGSHSARVDDRGHARGVRQVGGLVVRVGGSDGRRLRLRGDGVGGGLVGAARRCARRGRRRPAPRRPAPCGPSAGRRPARRPAGRPGRRSRPRRRRERRRGRRRRRSPAGSVRARCDGAGRPGCAATRGSRASTGAGSRTLGRRRRRWTRGDPA